jgi:hypothetical protein
MKKNLILLIIIGIFALFSNVFFTQAATPESFFYLSWEADSLTPIDYSGKILATVDGVIKVSVQPLIYSSGAYADSSQWSYRWYLNDEFANVDGVGIKQFRFRVKGYNETIQTVKVKITFPNGIIQEKSIIIPIISPKVVVKSNSQSLIIRDKALSTNESEISLLAIPYFFSGTKNSLKIKWYLNDEYQNHNGLISSPLVVKNDIANNLIKVLVSRSDDSLIRGIGQLTINFLGI